MRKLTVCIICLIMTVCFCACTPKPIEESTTKYEKTTLLTKPTTTTTTTRAPYTDISEVYEDLEIDEELLKTQIRTDYQKYTKDFIIDSITIKNFYQDGENVLFNIALIVSSIDTDPETKNYIYDYEAGTFKIEA